MSEVMLWRRVVKPVLAPMGHVDRIESHSTSTGRPDVNVCLADGTVWDIELKVHGIKPAVIRPAQLRWFRQRVRVGGNCCVIVRVNIEGPYYGIVGGRKVHDMVRSPRTKGEWVEAFDVVYDSLTTDELKEYFNEHSQK